MSTKEIKDLKNRLSASENEDIRNLYHIMMYESDKVHFWQFQTIFFLVVIIFLLVFIGSTFWDYEPLFKYLVEQNEIIKNLGI